jgi:hypothetical protein
MTSTTGTNKNMTTARALQGILDDKKEELPSGLYKELCDAMMKMDAVERKDREDFYRVHYVYSLGQGDDGRVEMHLAYADEIIQIPSEKAATVSGIIEEKGACHGCYLSNHLTFDGFETACVVPIEPDREVPDNAAHITLGTHCMVTRLTKL